MIDLRRLDASISAMQHGSLSHDQGSEIANTIAEYGSDAILPLLVFLSEHGGANRQFALSAFQKIGDAATPKLSDYLRNDPRLRGASASALASVGTDEAIRVLDGVLTADLRTARTMRKRKAFLRIASRMIAVILLVSAVFMLFGDSAQRLLGKYLVIGAAALLFGSEQYANYKPAAIAALGESQDGRLAATLVPYLADERDVAGAAAASLTKLLPLVTETSATRFTTSDVEALIRVLDGRDVDLIKATLGALAVVGDERALPVVERLAVGSVTGRKYEVRLAAEACLPALRARIELQRKANTLLRPAPDSPAPLLRPAASMPSDESQLVRPVDVS